MTIRIRKENVGVVQKQNVTNFTLKKKKNGKNHDYLQFIGIFLWQPQRNVTCEQSNNVRVYPVTYHNQVYIIITRMMWRTKACLTPATTNVFPMPTKCWPSKRKTICITFVQCWTNVKDVGPTLYKCYTNVLCLLGGLTSRGRLSGMESGPPFDLHIYNLIT